MVKTLICCFLSAVVASIVTWRIVGSRVPPTDVMDTAGSRSLGEPWPTPEWFHREENVFSRAEQKVLNSAQQFTIFAPIPMADRRRAKKSPENFTAFPSWVKRKFAIPQNVRRCCTHCITGSTIPTAMPPLVSILRHGIRVTSNGETVDLVICFACLKVDVYFGNQARQLLTSRLPQPVFNQAFRNANLPIAK